MTPAFRGKGWVNNRSCAPFVEPHRSWLVTWRWLIWRLHSGRQSPAQPEPNEEMFPCLRLTSRNVSSLLMRDGRTELEAVLADCVEDRDLTSASQQRWGSDWPSVPLGDVCINPETQHQG